MKIGVDFDGVIFNFERELLTYAELFDLLELKKNGAVDNSEHFLKKRYNWSDEETKKFVDQHFVELSKKTALMPGADTVLNMLKADGHELVLITARGRTVPEMKDVALERLAEYGLVFDKYYWEKNDKLEVAKSEQLDFMIDDYGVTCETLANNGIRSIYFRDVAMTKYPENEFFIEANNWGEIYRIISNAGKTKK